MAESLDMLAAFVDESIHEAGVGAYVLGCVEAPIDGCHDIRTTLQKQGLFSFRKATDRRRRAMLQQIGGWGLGCYSYHHRGLYQTGRTQARKSCLLQLLASLSPDVTQIVIETQRTEREETWDTVTIHHARNRGITRSDLSFGFMGKLDEPMLWPADAIASGSRTTLLESRGWEKELLKIGTVITPVR